MFCIFMTYSTSYCWHYKLMDPWNIYVCVCALHVNRGNVNCIGNMSL
jgi:hypothetical protein